MNGKMEHSSLLSGNWSTAMRTCVGQGGTRYRFSYLNRNIGSLSQQPRLDSHLRHRGYESAVRVAPSGPDNLSTHKEGSCARSSIVANNVVANEFVWVNCVLKKRGTLNAASTARGAFATTSVFARATRDDVARAPRRSILTDGDELARLMFRHGIRVRTCIRHEIKQTDEDYFTELGQRPMPIGDYQTPKFSVRKVQADGDGCRVAMRSICWTPQPHPVPGRPPCPG